MMKSYFPITTREREVLDELKAGYVAGRPFLLAANSHRSRRGYHPCIRRDQYAKAVAAFAQMAGRSDALAQVAHQLIRACNPYVGADQFCAGIFEAAWSAVKERYTDVIRKSGPEAGRPSDWVRDYSLAETLAVACWIHDALDENGNLTATASGLGWGLLFTMLEERQNPGLYNLLPSGAHAQVYGTWEVAA